jgi:hypothetical protein
MVMRGIARCCGSRLCYRLIVEGEAGAEWAGWFGTASIVAADGVTAMQLNVTDQAELHGLLRRVHDLNLRIVELVRVDPQAAEHADGGQDDNAT